MMTVHLAIPVLLLKTESQPYDAYEEHFSSVQSIRPLESATPRLVPIFVPVLEHKPNKENLSSLCRLLESGGFKNRYGGMIFTSQRAVEGWIDTIINLDHRLNLDKDTAGEQGLIFQHHVDTQAAAVDSRSNLTFTTDVDKAFPFPLYVVGPATSRALATLLSDPFGTGQRSMFAQLTPEVLGAHTGNGANLAKFILQHYNARHTQRWFTFYEAPRLPFVPLIGMGSENYSRKRLEADDHRLTKKPLLFLVGEQRRDIIPTTLMSPSRSREEKIEVVEIEAYSTTVSPSFRQNIDAIVHSHDRLMDVLIAAIVIFSPQGAADALKAIGAISEDENVIAQHVGARWNIHDSPAQPLHNPTKTRYIIVAIGPTTRDYLKDKLGVEPDVCAMKPSPEGVQESIIDFLKTIGYW